MNLHYNYRLARNLNASGSLRVSFVCFASFVHTEWNCSGDFMAMVVCSSCMSCTLHATLKHKVYINTTYLLRMYHKYINCLMAWLFCPLISGVLRWFRLDFKKSHANCPLVVFLSLMGHRVLRCQGQLVQPLTQLQCDQYWQRVTRGHFLLLLLWLPVQEERDCGSAQPVGGHLIGQHAGHRPHCALHTRAEDATACGRLFLG